MALNEAATVTLCSDRKASQFWIILLLVAGQTDHGMIRFPLGCISAHDWR
jgi:hypothetical protein